MVLTLLGRASTHGERSTAGNAGGKGYASIQRMPTSPLDSCSLEPARFTLFRWGTCERFAKKGAPVMGAGLNTRVQRGGLFLEF